MELKAAGQRVLPQLLLRLDEARPIVAAKECSLYPKQQVIMKALHHDDQVMVRIWLCFRSSLGAVPIDCREIIAERCDERLYDFVYFSGKINGRPDARALGLLRGCPAAHGRPSQPGA